MGEHAYFSRSKAYSQPIDLHWLVLSVNQGLELMAIGIGLDLGDSTIFWHRALSRETNSENET
jgi:hypothetical protein